MGKGHVGYMGIYGNMAMNLRVFKYHKGRNVIFG
jgi:hypothetical protein